MLHDLLILALTFGADPGPPPAQAPPVQAPPVERSTSTPAAGNPAGLNGGGGVAISPAPPPVITYAEAREFAPTSGGIVVLIGDVKVPPFEHYYGAPVYRIREGTWPPSVLPGIYHVSRIGGVPHWWRSDWPQYVPTPVRGVPVREVRPVAAPFRGPPGVFDGPRLSFAGSYRGHSHTCEYCGRTSPHGAGMDDDHRCAWCAHVQTGSGLVQR